MIFTSPITSAPVRARRKQGRGRRIATTFPCADERGHLVLGAAAREAVLAAWEDSFDKRTLSRDVGRFEIAVPAGTVAPERLREALVEAFPAVSRQSFIWSRTSSVWRSIGASTTSPVSGSNGGSPET